MICAWCYDKLNSDSLLIFHNCPAKEHAEHTHFPAKTIRDDERAKCIAEIMDLRKAILEKTLASKDDDAAVKAGATSVHVLEFVIKELQGEK